MPSVLSKLNFCIVCDYCSIAVPSCYIDVTKRHSRCHMCRNKRYDILTSGLGSRCSHTTKTDKKLKRCYKNFEANAEEFGKTCSPWNTIKTFRPISCMG